MQVTIRLHATLKKYQPAGNKDAAIVLDVVAGATVADVITRLGIPAAHAKVMVSGGTQIQATSVLCEGQSVDLFPPLAGGA